MIEINIDGKVCTCEKGEYILNVAKRNDIEIPTLCHSVAVPGRGSCRLCIVEVEERGRRKIVTSCIYPVSGECNVFTQSDKVKEERAMVLAFLRKRAPHSDRIVELAERYGAPDIERITGIDADKCVLCGLCVKACATMGSGAIAEILRGTEKRVATPYDDPSVECLGCASCAHICPTGNIKVEDTADTRTIWHRTFELAKCSECGSVIGTYDLLEHAARRTGTEVQTLCDACRRRVTAHMIDEARVLQ